jgi:phage FluMu protein Com
MGNQLKYLRCWNCTSLLEVLGTFNFFAGNPFRLKCPVCGKTNDMENPGSYSYTVKNVIEQIEQPGVTPPIVQPVEVTKNTPTFTSNPFTSFFTSWSNNIRTLGIWVIGVLVLVLLIRRQK